MPEYIILKPPGINFGVRFDETSIYIHIFEKTTSPDIKKNWYFIKEHKKGILKNRRKKINIKVEYNEKTKENELYVQLFKETTREDVVKNWYRIKKQQDKLKLEKGIERRYYPSEDTKQVKKIKELRLQGLSDWEIQEELYGPITSIKETYKEKNRKNKMHQLLHRNSNKKEY